MYAVTILLRALDQEGAQILREASLDVVIPSREEEGCLFFDVLFDEQDPLQLRFYEAYVDRASFEAHLEAPHVKAWAALCMPILDRTAIRMPESVSDHGERLK